MTSKPRQPPDGADLFTLDPALVEKARRWFAEAREQTRRDDEEIAEWHRRRDTAGGDGGGGGSGCGSDGGDCSGGD